MSRSSLLEIGTINEVYVTATGLESTATEFVKEVFLYELSGCGFESRCSHLDITCFLIGGDGGYLLKKDYVLFHMIW